MSMSRMKLNKKLVTYPLMGKWKETKNEMTSFDNKSNNYFRLQRKQSFCLSTDSIFIGKCFEIFFKTKR